MSSPQVSLVVPVYNEQENLPELLDRLCSVADGMEESYEIVLVDDGSRDQTPEILRQAVSEREHLVAVELNRNYGQHAAVFAGFETSRGGIVVTLDADLQNPPEEIPKLVSTLREGGYDVVGSVRESREDALFRRIASRLTNRLTAWTTGSQLSDYGCMLRAYRRAVVDALCASGEISTFIPVLADLYAGRVTEVAVAHAERRRGKSKYSFWGLLRLQLDLLTSFTLLPLRATMALGVGTSLLSLLGALVLLGGRLIYGPTWAVSGVFTLFAFLFFLIGVLLFALGLLGEYVGRIYLEVRRRPRYVVRRVVRSQASEVAQ